MLSLYQRESIDNRSFGDLFRACCDELANLTFIQALKRILMDIMETCKLPEELLNNLIELVMGKALAYFGLKKEPHPYMTTVN